MKILTVKQKVKRLLEKHVMYRDNDHKLIARVWYDQLSDIGKTEVSAQVFLTFIAANRMANPESIRRTRQKLQEQYPELRGKTYRYKKIVEQNSVRHELGYNTQSPP